MNKAYRLIWNEPLNAWVVAYEPAHARGKRSSGRVGAGLAAVLLALSASGPLAAADLAPGALPSGGVVASGQAAFATSGNRLDITQSSQRAIINWTGFDIGSQAQVNFAQPNAAAVALNRVSGTSATRIEGQLSANGQVFLVNPNGVLFGAGARVNVGALVASTLSIRDDDFLAGHYRFTGNGGSIENRGTISAAPGGYLAFIAPQISNSGTLSAPHGTVALGAGERVTLNFAGDRLVGLSVSAETIDTLITNSQAIRAEGGAIVLSAAGAEAVTRSVINNSGVLEASSIKEQGGRIVLSAGGDINLGSASMVAVNGAKGGEIELLARSGTLLVDGTIEARGEAGTGGTVKLLGERVGLVNAARIDASGATGGGTVLVGGDYQGKNAEIQNAQRTYVSAGASIKADASERGDGGKVVVWSDGDTRYYGTISAQGGKSGGDGGLVEVSGKQNLDFNGGVNVGAADGIGGRVLLDPQNIVLSTAAAPPPPNNPNGTPDIAFADPPAVGTTNVQISTVTGFSELFLQATNNITVSNAVTMAANNSIRLEANNNITVAANVTTSGSGFINFRANGNLFVDATLTTSNGTGILSLSAGGTLTLNPSTLGQNRSILANNSTMSLTAQDLVIGSTSQNGNYNVNALNLNVNVVNDFTIIGRSFAGGPGFTRAITTNSQNVNVGNKLELNFGTGITGSNNSALLSTTGTGSQVINAGSIVVRGSNTSPGGRASIDAADQQTITASGNITLIGGSTNGATAQIRATGAGSQSITSTNGSIVLTNGAGVGSLASIVGSTTNSSLIQASNGAITANAGTLISGNAVTLRAPAVNLAGNLTGTGINSLFRFDLPAAGSGVNQTGGTLSASQGELTGSGTFNLTAGANDLVTLSANATGTANYSYRDTNAVELGASNFAGNLSVAAGGNITQSGLVSVSGASSFTTNGADADIVLKNPSNSFAGNVTASTSGAGSDADIRASGNLAFGASSVGGSFTGVATGTLNLNGTIGAGAGGDAIVLAAGGNFNNTGNFSLTPGTGRWLVYSTNPASDTRGPALLAAYDFKQYNTKYDPALGVLGILGSGDGFIYTVAPVITPALTGTVSKPFDGNNAATLAAANYTLSGAIDGDTVTLNNPVAGTFADPNVGTGIPVTSTGILITSSTSNAQAVFGYQLGSGTATANIGTITGTSPTVPDLVPINFLDQQPNAARYSALTYDLCILPVARYALDCAGPAVRIVGGGLRVAP